MPPRLLLSSEVFTTTSNLTMKIPDGQPYNKWMGRPGFYPTRGPKGPGAQYSAGTPPILWSDNNLDEILNSNGARVNADPALEPRPCPTNQTNSIGAQDSTHDDNHEAFGDARKFSILEEITEATQRMTI
ncbi:unnamed protein product [Trichogramma brassicae]|uniref:Uncharacterized protein n=1 Tax=Trichogramma brassicae TaxID=86971 RepID=A0A6H5J533_9HYME|nr:unnamed protein product [Trichogramma brassicae]